MGKVRVELITEIIDIIGDNKYLRNYGWNKL